MFHENAAVTPRAAAAIFVLGTVVFVILAAFAPSGYFLETERALLLSLRDPVNPDILAGPAWLQYFLVNITALGGWPLLTIFSVMLVIVFSFYRQWLYLAIQLAALIGVSIIIETAKTIFARVRPDFLPQLVEVTNDSFPSGHSASAAAFYLTLGLIAANLSSRKDARFFYIVSSIIFIMIIGVSRVYLGVHYPTDVVAGWALGSAWASLVWLTAWRIAR